MATYPLCVLKVTPALEDSLTVVSMVTKQISPPKDLEIYAGTQIEQQVADFRNGDESAVEVADVDRAWEG